MSARVLGTALVAAFVVVTATGCPGPQVVKVRELRPRPVAELPSLASRVAVPLDIAIASELPDPVKAGSSGLFSSTAMEIRDVSGFVDTDLAPLLRRWFETVQIVPADAAPAPSHLRMTVTLQALTVEDAQRPNLDPAGTVRAVLDWGVTMQGPRGEPDSFSFTDRVEGSSGQDGARVVEAVLSAALARFQNEMWGKLSRVR